MKVTKNEVLKLLKEGWELGMSHGLHPSAWIQKNGLGCGGESHEVHMASFMALLDKGLIELGKEGFPASKYRLAKQTRPDKEGL